MGGAHCNVTRAHANMFCTDATGCQVEQPAIRISNAFIVRDPVDASGPMRNRIANVVPCLMPSRPCSYRFRVEVLSILQISCLTKLT